MPQPGEPAIHLGTGPQEMPRRTACQIIGEVIRSLTEVGNECGEIDEEVSIGTDVIMENL